MFSGEEGEDDVFRNSLVDAVIGDATLDAGSAVVKRARAAKIPVTSSEWIIQSLIQGKCVDPKSHERYKHNYVDSSSS